MKIVWIVCFVAMLTVSVAQMSNTQGRSTQVERSQAYTTQQRSDNRNPALLLAGFQSTGTVLVPCRETSSNEIVASFECCPPDGGACTVFSVRKPIEAMCPNGGFNCGSNDPLLTCVATYSSSDPNTFVGADCSGSGEVDEPPDSSVVVFRRFGDSHHATAGPRSVS
jgi:hypothetical protein